MALFLLPVASGLWLAACLVNVAAVNYHFGSRDQLIAMLAAKLPHLDQSEIVFPHNAVLLGLGGLLRGASDSVSDSADQRGFVLRWVLASLRG